jgi:predicted RNA-binding protein YlqC (UPF0109 family)
MKELLDYILKNIVGENKYEIIEENEGDVIKLNIKVSDDIAGMVVGKGGKVIKAIRNLLRIKAILLKKKIILLVNS